MEQIAVVKTVLGNGMAEIAVERETACGAAHSCSECAGCEKMMTRTHNVVTAYNDARANPGDVVRVRSENAAFFKTAAIVYLLPLVLLMVFYGLSTLLPLPPMGGEASLGAEAFQILIGALGFAVGILLAVLWDRHMKKVNGLRFHIVEVKRACSGM